MTNRRSRHRRGFFRSGLLYPLKSQSGWSGTTLTKSFLPSKASVVMFWCRSNLTRDHPEEGHDGLISGPEHLPMRLTDDQWALLVLFLTPPEKATKRGRPRWDDRTLLEGILWVLRTGAQWEHLPQETYPPISTCFARFNRAVFPAVLGRLYELLEDQGLSDLREAFINGTFRAAKKGARTSGLPRKAKAPKSWSTRVAYHLRCTPTAPALPRLTSSRHVRRFFQIRFPGAAKR